MKLVFVTRKVDRGDSRTGFVHDWLNEFSGDLDALKVICLERGDTSGLAENIEVESMGKERGKDIASKFFRYLELLRRWVPGSDGLFIHMHPIYAIIAAPIAKIYQKPVVFWYTHKQVDFKLKLATWLVDRVVSASPESFRYKTDKVRFLGHGIPIEKFQSQETRKKKQETKLKILTVGRISRSKRLDLLIDALEIFKQRNPDADFVCKIVGGAELPDEQKYLKELKMQVKDKGLEVKIKFAGPVEYEKVPELYAQSDIFVNFSETGSLDKVVLEAAVSGCLILTSNEAFTDLNEIHHDLYVQPKAELIAGYMQELYELEENSKQRISEKLKEYVQNNHSLPILIEKILELFKQLSK